MTGRKCQSVTCFQIQVATITDQDTSRLRWENFTTLSLYSINELMEIAEWIIECRNRVGKFGTCRAVGVRVV